MATTTAPGTTDKPLKLTTTIPDPVHVGEIWTIETIQNDGEMLTMFVTRHMLAVQAVRKLL